MKKAYAIVHHPAGERQDGIPKIVEALYAPDVDTAFGHADSVITELMALNNGHCALLPIIISGAEERELEDGESIHIWLARRRNLWWFEYAQVANTPSPDIEADTSNLQTVPVFVVGEANA